MESTAVTRGAWIVVVIICLQAWSSTNSYLISRGNTSFRTVTRSNSPGSGILATSQLWHRLQQWPVMIKSWEWEHDFYFDQDPKIPVGHLLWDRQRHSVIYPLLIILYSCCATLINSVLESKLFAVAVWGYKHGIHMAGEVSIFFLWFPLGFCYSMHNDRCGIYGTKGQCFPKHNLLLWRAPLR